MTDPTAPKHGPQRRTRTERIAWFAFAVASLAVFATAFVYVAYRSQQGQISELKSQKYAAIGAATSANASLSAAGLPTIQVQTSAAAPTSTVTVTGPVGEQGPGPSTAQVSAAVVTFCEEHTCSSPPSSSDVASAVAEYCTGHAGCTGPAGATGPKGDTGQNATTDQIASAVQSYCSANGNCQGPQGATGPQGPTGAEIPSFTFTIQGALGSTTYVCDAPAYQCQAQ